MRIGTFFYCLRQGLKNIRRNLWISLVTAASISACIFLFCLFFAIMSNIRYIVQNAESAVGVTVFFDRDLTEERILGFGRILQDRPEVKEIRYISAEEAWENFQKEYFRDDEDLAAGFAEDNPLAESSSYEIYLNQIEDQKTFVEWLSAQDGVRKVNYSMDTASGLTRFNQLLSIVSAVIIGILLAVSIFLINSTISTAAQFHREETRIMRLIGATNFMIQAPFVVEGMLLGLLGTVIPLGICFFLYHRVSEYVMTRYHILSEVVKFIPIGEIFPQMAAVSAALGVGVGFIGSFFTIRKHLKV